MSAEDRAGTAGTTPFLTSAGFRHTRATPVDLYTSVTKLTNRYMCYVGEYVGLGRTLPLGCNYMLLHLHMLSVDCERESVAPRQV